MRDTDHVVPRQVEIESALIGTFRLSMYHSFSYS